MELALNLALNNLSFGQTSVGLIRQFYDDRINLKLFPIGGNIDLSSQKTTEDFNNYIKSSINHAHQSYSRKQKIFKLWHLNGSLESYGESQILFSFYELDSPTDVELNVVSNNKYTIFSSKYTCDIFERYGSKNIKYVPLFFDKNNFFNTNKKYFEDGRITFNLTGKLEKRKNHKHIIQSWIKKYGNNPRYSLQCAIFNPFLKQEDQNGLINSILEGKRYYNVSFLNFMQTNESYNDFLNSGDIIIGMSGGEGWGLPEFHSLALGKHGVILNAHAYKDWATKENSILVEPSKKIEAYDNMFFHKGAPYNQGNIFTFDEEAFIDGCEKAIERCRINKTNNEGLKLQDIFTIKNTTDKILNLMN